MFSISEYFFLIFQMVGTLPLFSIFLGMARLQLDLKKKLILGNIWFTKDGMVIDTQCFGYVSKTEKKHVAQNDIFSLKVIEH